MTEVFRDIVLAVSPGSEGDVAELPDLIRGTALLGPFRGQPAVDRAQLVAIIEAVARIAADHPQIAEIDVNPLLIRGGEPVAADALMVLSAEPAGAAAARDFTPTSRPCWRRGRWPSSAPPTTSPAGVVRRCRTSSPAASRAPSTRSIPRAASSSACPCRRASSTCPAPPDLALLAVGARQLQPVIAAVRRGGVQGRRRHRRRLLGDRRRPARRPKRRSPQTAADAGVTLIGPNCMGIIANATQLHATGFIALHPRPGNVGDRLAVGQPRRAALGPRRPPRPGRALLHRRRQRGAGERGGRARVPRRTTTGPPACSRTSRASTTAAACSRSPRATSRKKPVVVLRGGLTDSRRQGSRFAHRRHGRLGRRLRGRRPADRPRHLHVRAGGARPHDGARATCRYPRGRRVAVVTNGGGAGVLAADEMARQGLSLVDPPPELLAELDEILPPFWSRRNPFDMVATAGGDVGPRVVDAVARCPDVDAVIVLSVLGVPNTGDEVRAQSCHGRLRRLQPVGAALPRRGRRPHGGDRQADHQRPRPADPPRAVRRRPPLRSGRRRPLRGRRPSCSSAWLATAPGAPGTRQPHSRQKDDA